jgi:uncharacterized alpha-E superfamily protein
MLARTADAIYWVSRYMERADFLARIIQATQRLAGLPTTYVNIGPGGSRGQGTEWDSTLEASGAAEGFHKTGAVVNEKNVVEYLAFSTENPSSIRNCIAAARANARAIRVALTTEMWEAINGAWFELIRFEQLFARDASLTREELTRFLDFVNKASLDFDGCAYRTMLRNDAYWFSRIGVYLERADNTARILDVKYNVLLPETEVVGGSLDYFQWTAILRAVSALTAYHWVYRQSIKPWLVADLLILKPDMPRSLIACYDNLVFFLDHIGRAYGRQGQAQRQARDIYERLQKSTTREIFQSGLHEFITGFVEENHKLGETIGVQYLALLA